MIERADSPLVAELYPSPNCEPRRGGLNPSILLLHYTGLPTAEKALEVLSRRDCKVSCHYVIDEEGRIVQMVAEAERAWHAGQAFWAGERDINSASIGIEVHNPGHELGYPDFPAKQMEAVIALSRDIVRRRAIRPERVLAHSDVAPFRKIDPGEKFDWSALAKAAVGNWVPPEPVDPADPGLGLGDSGEPVAKAQSLLARYGYKVPVTAVLGEATRDVLSAFQRHFRPARVDGRLDRSTLATLERLVAALPEGR